MKTPISLVVMGLCYLKLFQRLHFDYIKIKAKEQLRLLE